MTEGEMFEKAGLLPASEDPRFELLKMTLKQKRPKDWKIILDKTVSKFQRFLENGDDTIWKDLDSDPHYEDLLTNPMPELGQDAFGHEQTALSFIKNRLQREKDEDKPLFTTSGTIEEE